MVVIERPWFSSDGHGSASVCEDVFLPGGELMGGLFRVGGEVIPFLGAVTCIFL
jgi:hypothetical protein